MKTIYVSSGCEPHLILTRLLKVIRFNGSRRLREPKMRLRGQKCCARYLKLQDRLLICV